MAHPIWQDYFVSVGGFGSFAYADFAIIYDGNTIYEGRAYGNPDNADEVQIKINDICANYIRNAFPSFFPDSGSEEQRMVFAFSVDIIEYDTNDEDYQGGTVQVEFLNDWSYEYNRDFDNLTLTAPILRKIPRNAPLIYSAFENNEVITGSNSLQNECDTVNVVNLAEFVGEEDTWVDIAMYDKVTRYELTDDCYRYMLYYLNAYGGWDFLLVEGKDKQTDTYTRHTLGQAYDNTQSRNRGTRNYRNDIVRKWELHTLWIDDAGAQNMHHLLGSVDVYLYDLKEAQLYPITLENTSCEFKTYKNQGNQLVRYDIEATLATNRTRR